MKKDNKKAMVAAWSDSQSSESESDEEYTTTICLMAKKHKTTKKLSMETKMRQMFPHFMNILMKN